MFVNKRIQLHMAKTNDNIKWIIQWKLKAVKLKKYRKKVGYKFWVMQPLWNAVMTKIEGYQLSDLEYKKSIM